MDLLRNTQLYIGAIVLGVLALIVGVMFIANILLGFHPTRAYIAFGVGIILLLVGIVGMVSTRSRGQL